MQNYEPLSDAANFASSDKSFFALVELCCNFRSNETCNDNSRKQISAQQCKAAAKAEAASKSLEQSANSRQTLTCAEVPASASFAGSKLPVNNAAKPLLNNGQTSLKFAKLSKQSATTETHKTNQREIAPIVHKAARKVKQTKLAAASNAELLSLLLFVFVATSTSFVVLQAAADATSVASAAEDNSNSKSSELRQSAQVAALAQQSDAPLTEQRAKSALLVAQPGKDKKSGKQRAKSAALKLAVAVLDSTHDSPRTVLSKDFDKIERKKQSKAAAGAHKGTPTSPSAANSRLAQLAKLVEAANTTDNLIQTFSVANKNPFKFVSISRANPGAVPPAGTKSAQSQAPEKATSKKVASSTTSGTDSGFDSSRIVEKKDSASSRVKQVAKKRPNYSSQELPHAPMHYMDNNELANKLKSQDGVAFVPSNKSNLASSVSKQLANSLQLANQFYKSAPASLSALASQLRANFLTSTSTLASVLIGDSGGDSNALAQSPSLSSGGGLFAKSDASNATSPSTWLLDMMLAKASESLKSAVSKSVATTTASSTAKLQQVVAEGMKRRNSLPAGATSSARQHRPAFVNKSPKVYHLPLKMVSNGQTTNLVFNGLRSSLQSIKKTINEQSSKALISSALNSAAKHSSSLKLVNSSPHHSSISKSKHASNLQKSPYFKHNSKLIFLPLKLLANGKSASKVSIATSGKRNH